jgi:hypothetical protein
MPHAAVELADGVNVNRTPALNQYGISASQLIRYQFDNSGQPMVQKLGGWQKYIGATTPAPVRALWGWEDTNAVKHLAYGTDSFGGRTQLAVVTNGSAQDITPTSATTNGAPSASTVAGSPIVTINDPAMPGVTAFDTVYIQNMIAVGGLILFGQYACNPTSPTSYQITARDVLGNPLPAPASSSAAVVAVRATTNGSPVVTVTLPLHGLSAGSNYAALLPQTIGGITIVGNYTVQSVPDLNTFTILASDAATATASAATNGGNARLVYNLGIGPTSPATGFGQLGFGVGPFGGTGQTVAPATGTPIAAVDWTLDNFGQALLSCPITVTPAGAAQYQPLYIWDPLSGTPQASVIAGAPTVNDGFFVAMPQRQIVCWGSTDNGIQDPLMVRWCDVNNPSQWIASPTNQAGKYRLPRGSKIVGGIQGPQQGFLWTDLSIWSMQYIGLPGVWGFNEIATGCGLISRKAAAAANGVVYWMGPTQFYSLTSEGVQPLACPIWDVAFQDMDPTNVDKIRVAVNSRFNEIAWHIPTLGGGGENGTFLKYNYALGWWDYGLLSRSAWIDQSVLGPPIGADPGRRLLYQHETSNDADGVALLASFATGDFALNEGDQMTFLDELWPDARYGDYAQPQNATLQITVLVRDFPEDPQRIYGPFTATQAVKWFNPRARGRLFSMQIASSDVGSFWRMGRFRYRGQPAGRYGGG